MHDSDDEYYSDFTLDDRTLAILVEEESKFTRSASTQAATAGSSPPPKRQKVATSWNAARPVQRNESVEDMDDLPDISVQMDGTYALQDRQRTTSPAPSSHLPTTSGPCLQPQRGLGPGVSSSRGFAPPLRARSVTAPSRATSLPLKPSSSTRTVRTAIPPSSQNPPRSQSGPPSRTSGTTRTGASDTLIADLHRQLQELQKSNDRMQAALQKSQAELHNVLDAKFAKEGEVSILRKGIEKTAQDHAAQIAKLKAAKDEGDAKQFMLQKQFEAEIERIKTEYTFKQHELESALRKPPGSVRAKKIAMGPPSTPMPIPSQIRTWGQGGTTAGPSRQASESPRHPRFGEMPKLERPKKHTSVDNRNLPTGFQSSLAPSQYSAGGKVDGRATQGGFTSPLRPLMDVATQLQPAPSSPPSNTSQEPHLYQREQGDVFVAHTEDGGGYSDNFAPIDVDIPVDVDMEGANLVLAPEEEEVEQAEPLNWNIALHRTILLHSTEEARISTLQLLMTVTFVDPDHSRVYGNALTNILDVLAGIPNHPVRDFGQTAETVCKAFCSMATRLALSTKVLPLAALLELLTHLTYTIPSFHILLLSTKIPDQDDTPQLISMLYQVVNEQLHNLHACSGDQHVGLGVLGRHTIYLLEAIAQTATGDTETRLSFILRSPSVLTVLLDPSRPQWFLSASVRFLAWLSTMPSLFRSLLICPESNEENKDGKQPILVDVLCALLVDPDRTSTEADKMKTWIMFTLGMLSVVHPDAFAHLVECQTLIPSVILRLCQLADHVWEAEDLQRGIAQGFSRTITTMVQTARFLHYLVMAGGFSLRERLHRAPIRKFNGLVHIFIETFGRLSYADPPDWISSADKQSWEKVADMSRTLLSLVVEGPEADLVWNTYQSEADDGGEIQMEADEEDMQAQLLDDP